MLHGAQPDVTLDTNFGQITIELFDDDAPGTVDNFLTYVADGDYVNSIFHRLAFTTDPVTGQSTPFVLQGGGFSSSSATICATAPCNAGNVNAALFAEVPTDPPIKNEPGLTNARGTVAMAKLGGNPDSATNQFFVNLNNNAGAPAFLDTQNGGFTVFGQVTDMTAVDQITAFSRVNLSSIFPANSRLTALSDVPVSGNRLVRVESITGTAILEGTVFLDNNGDGVKSSSELGMADRELFLDTNNSGAYDAGEPLAQTESDGSYFFRVAPGDYIVRARSVTDFQQTLVIGRYDTSMSLGRSERDLNFGLKYTGQSWTNPLNNLDVDATEGVTLRDVVQIINEIRLHTVSSSTGQLPPLTSPPSVPTFYDVNQDGNVVLSDAVAVINFIALNQTAAAQEAASLTVMAEPLLDVGTAEVTGIEMAEMAQALPAETSAMPADFSGVPASARSSYHPRSHDGPARSAARVLQELANDAALAELDVA